MRVCVRKRKREKERERGGHRPTVAGFVLVVTPPKTNQGCLSKFALEEI